MEIMKKKEEQLIGMQMWLMNMFGISSRSGYKCTGILERQSIQNYPILSEMAKDYLTIQASSVASKRAFSSGTESDSADRCKLGGDTIEKTQFLKYVFCWRLLVGLQLTAADGLLPLSGPLAK
jgi:hypothetical protein